MRFRQTEENGIPTIDLIPMLTVMMGVLAFFVVISVSLSSEQLIQIDLPPESTEDTPTASEIQPEPFIIELDATGQQRLNDAPIAAEQLVAEVQAYLARYPDRIVYLVPSRELPYEQVIQFLGDMRSIGGDRISLALEKTTAESTAGSTTGSTTESTAESIAEPNPAAGF